MLFNDILLQRERELLVDLLCFLIQTNMQNTLGSDYSLGESDDTSQRINRGEMVREIREIVLLNLAVSEAIKNKGPAFSFFDRGVWSKLDNKLAKQADEYDTRLINAYNSTFGTNLSPKSMRKNDKGAISETNTMLEKLTKYYGL